MRVNWQVIVAMCRDAMVMFTRFFDRVYMDDSLGQITEMVKKLMVDFLRYLMPFTDGEGRRNGNIDLRV